MKKKAILLIIFLSSYGLSFSQVISFSALVNKNRIVIGEPVQMRLQAIVPASSSIAFPEIDSLPHFEVLNRSGIDSAVSFNGLRLEQIITITSWDSGSWNIPQLVFQNARSKPIAMEVGYSSMDPDQPYHDIKDIMDVPKPEQPAWIWYLLALGLLLILFILFFPGTKQKAMEKKTPAEDPYKRAMKDLAGLDPSADSKIFFTELVDVFREYLENRKGIRSYSKITDDLVIQLKAIQFSQDQYTELAQVLRMSDLAKYARLETTEQEKLRATNSMKENISVIEKNR
jgi:hypothetical protein